MYEPICRQPSLLTNPRHCSAKPLTTSDALQIWPRKRDLVKQCEVGLPVQLRAAELKLESLYTHNANGNASIRLEALIATRLPLPQGEPAAGQPDATTSRHMARVIGQRNPQLAASIERQLKPSHGCSGS